ncbi:MAG: beta-aspartyl-peptidase [Flavobacteriales bacterium]|nr:beta-aspartyl-peptidase [Flavobacteriales bacterium]
MMLLIKNAKVFDPEDRGPKDILVAAGRIVAIEDQIEPNSLFKTWDAEGRILAPGIIDQHIHIIGAGGKRGFVSMTPEIAMTDLIACGTTTVVGLLGTDASTRSIHTLYAKCKALDVEGITAYMYTGYFGLEPKHIMDSVQDEMIFIDKVLGCKIAISDVRSSYPTDLELLRVLRQVRVGGMIGDKKGIMHIHLGALEAKIDCLIRIVEEHEFPIENISPTHMGRTKPLLEQGVTFAKMGGMIDISTGGTNYTEPYLAILHALDLGASIDKITLSSDGYTCLDRKDENGKVIGIRKALFDQNVVQAVKLAKNGLSLTDALKTVTLNPAINLGLKHKGRVAVGADADFCCFDESLQLTDVFAHGKQMMADGKVTAKNVFDRP